MTLELKSFSGNGTQGKIMRFLRDNPLSSRSDVVVRTGLPAAAVTRSFQCLMEKGCVEEAGLAKGDGPRRKQTLQILPDCAYTLGIEYGAHSIEGVLVNAAFGLSAKIHKKINLQAKSQKKRIDSILKFIEQMIENQCADVGGGDGIALLDPGLVDSEKGIALGSSIFVNWVDVPIASILEKALGIPVKLLHATQSKMVGVERLENCRHHRNMIYIEYGEGVACAMKVGGEIVVGEQGFAGEFGHQRVGQQRVLCKCGKQGCLEALVAQPALCAAMDDVFFLAAGGDKEAIIIVKKGYSLLASSIANLINILNPQCVVLDRSLLSAGPALGQALLEQISDEVLLGHGGGLSLVFSQATEPIGPYGAAASLMNEILT